MTRYPGSTPPPSTTLGTTTPGTTLPVHVRHAGTDRPYTPFQDVLGEPLGSRSLRILLLVREASIDPPEASVDPPEASLALQNPNFEVRLAL